MPQFSRGGGGVTDLVRAERWPGWSQVFKNIPLIPQDVAETKLVNKIRDPSAIPRLVSQSINPGLPGPWAMEGVREGSVVWRRPFHSF